jgi:hypothetical protein
MEDTNSPTLNAHFAMFSHTDTRMLLSNATTTNTLYVVSSVPVEASVTSEMRLAMAVEENCRLGKVARIALRLRRMLISCLKMTNTFYFT